MSAEHVSSVDQPLNLKKFIYDLDVPVIVGGAATYTAALHLMRTGAAGVLVGFGGGAASTTRATLGIHAPMATAVADVAGARRDYLDESGGRYVHVIADGGVGTSGDLVKALAMGADAVMLGVALARATDAPGLGYHWGPEAHHSKLPRGRRVKRRPGRHARGGPLRTGARRRRHREPHRGAAQVDGHDRILRPQGVPARRGRRRAVQRRMTADRRPIRDRLRDRDAALDRGLPADAARGHAAAAVDRSCCCSASSSPASSRGSASGSWAARSRPTRPRRARREEVRPIEDVVAPGAYLPEPLVGQRVDVGRLVDRRGLPHRRVALQRRRRGVLGHRPAAAVGRCDRIRPGRRPVSLAVALGWAPTREEADAAASALEKLVADGAPAEPLALTGRLISDEGPALPPRGADPQTMTTMSSAALLGQWHDVEELSVYRPYLVSDEAPEGLDAHLVARAGRGLRRQLAQHLLRGRVGRLRGLRVLPLVPPRPRRLGEGGRRPRGRRRRRAGGDATA